MPVLVPFIHIQKTQITLLLYCNQSTLQILREHAAPKVLPEDVKYVLFSELDPPQDFSKTQQTPKEEAQDPDDAPLYEKCTSLSRRGLGGVRGGRSLSCH